MEERQRSDYVKGAVIRYLIAIVAVALVGGIFNLVHSNSALLTKTKDTRDLNEIIEKGEDFPEGEYVSLNIYWTFGQYAGSTQEISVGHSKSGFTSGNDYYYLIMLEDYTLMSLKVSDNSIIRALDAQAERLQKADSLEELRESVNVTGKLSVLDDGEIKEYYQETLTLLGVDFENNEICRMYVLDTTSIPGRNLLIMCAAIAGVVLILILIAVIFSKKKEKNSATMLILAAITTSLMVQTSDASAMDNSDISSFWDSFAETGTVQIPVEEKNHQGTDDLETGTGNLLWTDDLMEGAESAANYVSNAVVSSYYPDGANISYKISAYNPAAPDWGEYDNLINQIKNETNLERRVSLMHRAEDILMGTGAVVPLYYYNDLYLQKPDVQGVYSNLFGFKYFQFATCNSRILRINLANEPARVDPALNSSVDGACLAVNLFEGLYTYNADGMLVPALCDPANPYEMSSDGLTYTFHLRGGLTWSDGTPLTARDFEYSWKRACAPETGADYAYMFDCFARVGDTINVTAIDDLTLVAVLNTPCAYFLDLVAFPTYLPVPQEQVQASEWIDPGAWAAEAGFVTNGAYTMQSWSHESSMILVKNPNYYRANDVMVEEIDLMLSSDDIAIYTAYQAGSLDFADTVPNNEIQALLGREEFHVVDNLGTYYAAFNVNSSLFAGKTVDQANAMRKAISLLIDRQYIVDTIGQTGQKIATSFIPEGMTDGNGSIFKENSNIYTFPYLETAGYYPAFENGVSSDAVEEARRLLEFAGYCFTEEGVLSNETPIHLTYLTNDGTGHIAIAESIQQNLDVLGIEMDIQTMEWNVFLEERKQGHFDFAREGWLADYNDPINMLEMWASWSGNNDCQFGKNSLY